MDTYPKSRARHPIIWFATFILLATGFAANSEESSDWTNSLTSDKGPGSFMAAPSVRLAYRFGWSGLRAAKADIHLYSPTRSTFELDASGGTSGFPRALFRFDVVHHATENKLTLRPIHFSQEEKYRSETVKTDVAFGTDEVTGLREKVPSENAPKPNVFKFSPVFDMTTAVLWVRSQPLADGETESLVVWASNAPYLAKVTVVGRDTIKIEGKSRNAIKLDLRLFRIDKKMQLKEHKLFKGGRGWLSDDEKRIPLRVEADMFIGYVFAELESMQLE